MRIKLDGPAGNNMGLGAKVTLTQNHSTQLMEQTLTRGFQSSVEPVMHFGLGEYNSPVDLKVEWPGGNQQVIKGVEPGQVYTIRFSDSSPAQMTADESPALFTDVSAWSGIDFVHRENTFDDYAKEILLPHSMAQFGPRVAAGDVDGDGKEDLFIGGAAGQAGVVYRQADGGKFERWKEFTADQGHEDLGGLFFDADGDGDEDLYVVSGGSEFEERPELLQDRLYENDGKGGLTRSTGRLPEETSSGLCVAGADMDKDGDMDLFVGGRVVPGKYPFAPRSYLLLNNGGRFADATGTVGPELESPGMVSSAVWMDYDADGWEDLVVTGEWMTVRVYRNESGKLKDMTGPLGLDKYTGWWQSLAAADLDGDGDKDLVAGNLGLNSKFTASEQEPLTVYCHDFDNSGTLDIVLGYYNTGTCYPVRGRTCSSQQMPVIREKFPTYHEFASSSLQQVYGAALNEALGYKANELRTGIFINTGKGFEFRALPAEAQFSMVFGIIPEDFDRDGQMDLLMAGNFWVPEVETGRNDAGIGLYLKGSGKGTFAPVKSLQSGFLAPKDVRDLAMIIMDEVPFVLVANNNDAVQVFRFNKTID